MNIGQKIKELRLYNDLTQIELSKKADISRSVLSAYENNTATPTATVIAKIAIALNVSADYLLGLENDYGVRIAPELAPMGGTITAKERELLETFRTLSPYLQGLALDTLRGFAGNVGGDGLHKKA